jgi:hypothetical protein
MNNDTRRQADLGNGNCLNPIVVGDHPAPSILKRWRVAAETIRPHAPALQLEYPVSQWRNVR